MRDLEIASLEEKSRRWGWLIDRTSLLPDSIDHLPCARTSHGLVSFGTFERRREVFSGEAAGVAARSRAKYFALAAIKR